MKMCDGAHRAISGLELSQREIIDCTLSGWLRAGRPARRGGHSREQRFGPSTEGGCSQTGPDQYKVLREHGTEGRLRPGSATA